MEYFVYMTNDCNLNCKYCSVLLDCEKNNLPIKPTYKNEELLGFMEKELKKSGQDDLTIYFFGGEPTMVFDGISKLIKDANAYFPGKAIKYVLHTNGLLSKEIPQDVMENLALIVYSTNYEMVPKIHLANSYFSKIVDNAMFLRDTTNVPVNGRLTITEETSLYTTLMQLTPYFKLIYWQLENTSAFKDFDAFYETYAYEVTLAFDWWLNNLREGKMYGYIPFMGVLKFMFYDDHEDSFLLCGYGRTLIYVQTDGKCYACCDNVESSDHFIGDIKNGISFPECKPAKTICGDCKYFKLCKGRCGRLHREFTEEHAREYCKLNAVMFELFLKHKDELESLLKKYPHYKEMLFGWLLDTMEYTP